MMVGSVLEVKRLKDKVTGSQSAKALLLTAATRYVRVYMRSEDTGTATLNSHAVPGQFCCMAQRTQLICSHESLQFRLIKYCSKYSVL